MTTTVIRSRTVLINGREYADIVYTETYRLNGSSRMDTRRHIYAVDSEGRTALLADESFISEQMGTNNWNNVHTVAKIARLKEKGEVLCE